MNTFLSVVVYVHLRLLRAGSLATLALTVVLFGASGCGGGGGGSNFDSNGGGITPEQPPPSPREPPSNPDEQPGTVTVSVIDPFGQPVAEAVVSSDQSGWFTDTADSEGVMHYSAWPGPVTYYHFGNRDENAPVHTRGEGSGILDPAGHLDITITAQPWSETDGIGVTGAQVAVNGISEDGRSLDFSVRLIHSSTGADGWQLAYRVNACAPDNINDAAEPRAHCVEGAPGFDAPYRAGNSGLPLEIVELPPVPAATYFAAVLFDQGGKLVRVDPNDARLYMLRYFLLKKHAGHSVAVMAFGGNNIATGVISTLPQLPLTVFPAHDPQFTTDGASLFPAVDSLAFSERGTSPLFVSMLQAVEFTATHTPPESRRMIVVLADGEDNTCGTEQACQQARQQLLDRLRATGIGLVTIGIGDLGKFPNGRGLSRLAAQAGGTALWSPTAHTLADVFEILPALLDGSAPFRLARFRLESPVEGTFAAGRTVLGTLSVTQTFEGVTYGGGFGTQGFDIPFEVRIP